MPEDKTQARGVAICLTAGDAQSRGEAVLDIWNKKRAKKKGRSIWMGCWVGAVLSIAIPIVHFLTVPLLLVVGPVAGHLVYKLFDGSIDVISGSGTCPACKHPINLQPTSATWPLSLTCGSCQAQVAVTRAT